MLSGPSDLCATLSPLTNPHRLAIIEQLRTPHTLSEIRVVDTTRGTSAPLARQTVSRHLELLVGAGLVTARPASGDARETLEYSVNHQRIFLVADQLRSLARLRPAIEPAQRTERSASATTGSPRGPCLVLVHGLDEGTRFDLRPRPKTADWVIGRRRDAAVCLDFDPSVSGQNAIVHWDDGRYSVEDVPGSRNGTLLNFARLPSGERRELHHGDVIGVGRCLLLFWR
ncbi:MAG TPA: FHA domain-containing protein [Candidatus Thermoplasmatota archaeon]|nr:FHA domain-containing protein [Candidatus Thermoplasmatota archaeon]